MIKHYHIKLPVYPRGFHLITNQILKATTDLPEDGVAHIFIQHTSAGLCINENADGRVLEDFEMVFNKLIPEKGLPYKHTLEGLDDMPAHIKSVLTGSGISIPIVNRKLALGIWQGIYLCEFRNHATPRNLLMTIIS